MTELQREKKYKKRGDIDHLKETTTQRQKYRNPEP